jgi:hypothetical protein
LYGDFNTLTLEWTDGLAAGMLRAAAMAEEPLRRWTVFDGPIDAAWIENMNTVLDDNMMLCLANGERIRLKSSMRLVFEVQDLEKASPATVSRLGVVYFAPESVGWAALIQSWIQVNVSLPPFRRRVSYSLTACVVLQTPAVSAALCPGIRDRVLARMQSLVRLSLAAMKRDNQRQLTPCVEVNLVASMCAFFQSCCLRESINLNIENITTFKVWPVVPPLVGRRVMYECVCVSLRWRTVWCCFRSCGLWEPPCLPNTGAHSITPSAR